MSKRQLVFITACFVQGSFMYTMYYYQISGNESWLTLFAGILISFIIISIYGALYKCHYDAQNKKAKGLIEINKSVYGDNGGKVISIIYVGSLMLSSSRMLREAGQFVAGNLLMGINWKLILVVFILLCVWASRYGIKYFASMGTITCLIMYIFTIILFLLLLPHSKAQYLLPIGNKALTTYVKGVSLCTALPFAEMAAFLILACDITGEKPIDLKKELAYGIIAGSPFLVISILRDTLVLGPLMSEFSYPGYEVIRLINYNVFSNVESLYGVIILFLMFFKSALLFYSITKALGQIFNCKQNGLFYFFVSLSLYLTSTLIAESNVMLSEKVQNSIPYILLAVNVGLPVITLIISRKKSS